MKGLESKTIKLESGTELTVRGLKVKQTIQLMASFPEGFEYEEEAKKDDKNKKDPKAKEDAKFDPKQLDMMLVVMEFVSGKACVSPVVHSVEDEYYIESTNGKEELTIDCIGDIVTSVFELSFGESKKATDDKKAVKKGTKVNG